MFSLQKTFSIIIAFVLSLNANALSVYYDSQIDFYLTQLSQPLLKSAKLDNVTIYLASDDKINAFATSNNEIFIHSGLVAKTTNQEQLQGVLAHEIGHLVARHHIKGHIKNEKSNIPGILGAIFGAGAIIAGAPDAGLSAILGGSALGVSNQLVNSREHENEADLIAIKLLKENKIDPAGLAEFFALLEQQERVFIGKIPAFLSTHPSSDRRKEFMRANANQQRITHTPKNYLEFKAKVIGLTHRPSQIATIFNQQPNSSSKSLALAFMHWKKGDLNQAIFHLNNSTKQGLDKHWYYDLAGQLAYDFAKPNHAITAYKKSQKLGNNSWILDFQLAEAYLQQQQYNLALTNFIKVTNKFNKFSYTLKRIAETYFAQNNQAFGHYFLALYYQKTHNKKLTKYHIKLAQKHYKEQNLNIPVLLNNINELITIDDKNMYRDKNSR